MPVASETLPQYIARGTVISTEGMDLYTSRAFPSSPSSAARVSKVFALSASDAEYMTLSLKHYLYEIAIWRRNGMLLAKP